MASKEPNLVMLQVEKAVDEMVISKSKQKKKKKSKPVSENGINATPFVPQVSFARASTALADAEKGKRSGRGNNYRGNNFRGNNFRGNNSGNFNRGGYSYIGSRSRHPNAPPPISLQRRNAQGPLPTFEEVQKGTIFDYVGWMEEEMRANSPSYAYNADFPPLGVDLSKSKDSGQLTGSGSSDVLERSNNNIGPFHSPSTTYDNAVCSDQQSFVMMPNTVYGMPNDVYLNEPLMQYVDSPPIYFTAANYLPVINEVSMIQERDEVIKRQIEFYFSTFNLKKDGFIRSAMDSKGFVPLITIVGFPKVQMLTNDISLISRILQHSKEVELDGTGLKVRAKRNWEKWLPSSQTTKLEAAEQNERHEQVSVFIIESGDSDEELHNKHEAAVEVRIA